MKKKIRKKNGKKIAVEIWMGYYPNCICEKKKNCIETVQLYCMREGWEKKLYCNCIAREGLEWLDFVSQYNHCIVIEGAGWLGLKIVLQYNYCIACKRRLGWKFCIAIHHCIVT